MEHEHLKASQPDRHTHTHTPIDESTSLVLKYKLFLRDMAWILKRAFALTKHS